MRIERRRTSRRLGSGARRSEGSVRRRDQSTVLLLAALLCGCPSRTIEDTLPAYSKAYSVAFDRLKIVELTDTQTRIQRLGDAGKAFEPELAELRRGQAVVMDLLVKSVELKKKGLADKKPATVDEAIKLLGDADEKAQRLGADAKRLSEKLTAAGAPEIIAEPRDPNARD